PSSSCGCTSRPPTSWPWIGPPYRRCTTRWPVCRRRCAPPAPPPAPPPRARPPVCRRIARTLETARGARLASWMLAHQPGPPAGRAPAARSIMRYRRLGSSDLEVSEISLGPSLTFVGGVGFEQTRACTDAAFEAGINFFDTANVYGRG